MRRYRVALLGYYGFGNLGDELLLQSCLELLGRDGVIVLSNDPEGTSRTFGVESVNRWKLREVARVLRQSRALVLGGGGLFQDSTSVKSCVWYWSVVRLARMLGCRVFALGQSVGPLKSGLSRALAGDALRACDRVHVRDGASLRLAESLGCREVVLGCDLVLTGRRRFPTPSVAHDNQLSLPLPRRLHGTNTASPCFPPTHPHVLAVCPPTADGAMLVNLRPCPELEHYAKILAPHIDADTIGVALSGEDVKAMECLKLQRVVQVRSFDEAQSLWAGASCAVGMRLHFGVLSRVFRVPVSLMPYDVKVSEFAAQSGVPCIYDEWQEPVMPREVPEDECKVDDICREIISL